MDNRKPQKKEKVRQYNGQRKKDKGVNNDIQNTIQKAKDRATRNLTKTPGELMCSGIVTVPDPRWHPSCTSWYKAGDKSWQWKWPDCNYDKRNCHFWYIEWISNCVVLYRVDLESCSIIICIDCTSWNNCCKYFTTISTYAINVYHTIYIYIATQFEMYSCGHEDLILQLQIRK